MFEKAREFREKYYTPVQAMEGNSELIRANVILDKHAQRYARKAAQIKSEILVLEREISLIQNEVDEFMQLYYEKFSAVPIDKINFSTGEKPLESAFNENDKTVSLFEKRSEAFSQELKNIYRKLAKNLHPDVNYEQFDAKYFRRVQGFYEKGDLAELIYIYSQIECGNDIDKNIINKIERLEIEIRHSEKKLLRLIERKSEIISSTEHQLFIKFKLSEIRGYNFFEELLKRAELNISH